MKTQVVNYGLSDGSFKTDLPVTFLHVQTSLPNLVKSDISLNSK